MSVACMHMLRARVAALTSFSLEEVKSSQIPIRSLESTPASCHRSCYGKSPQLVYLSQGYIHLIAYTFTRAENAAIISRFWNSCWLLPRAMQQLTTPIDVHDVSYLFCSQSGSVILIIVLDFTSSTTVAVFSRSSHWHRPLPTHCIYHRTLLLHVSVSLCQT
jgi:hypothetical protein